MMRVMIEKAKPFIKSAFPGGVRMYRRLRAARQPDRTMQQIFSSIYKENSWGNPESVSGRGSTIARTGTIRSALPDLLASIDARSMLDAGCGDFHWMRHVDLGNVDYIGWDVVSDIIISNHRLYASERRKFFLQDATKDQIPGVDVILCRECFIHLSFKHIRDTIKNFKRSKAKFLLATTHVSVSENHDAQTGGWRSLNLQIPPFNFPNALRLIMEDREAGKCLGLWRMDEL